MVEDLGAFQVVDERFPGDRERSGIEQVLYLVQDRAQAAGTEEVLHEESARRLQVDKQRDLRTGRVEVVLGQGDTEASCDGEEVHDGIGRPAERRERNDGVEK